MYNKDTTLGKLNNLFKKRLKLNQRDKELSDKIKQISIKEIERLVRLILNDKPNKAIVINIFGNLENSLVEDDDILFITDVDNTVCIERELFCESGLLKEAVISNPEFIDMIKKLTTGEFKVTPIEYKVAGV